MTLPPPRSREGHDVGEKFAGALALLLVLLIAGMEGGVLLPEIAKMGTDTLDTWCLGAQFCLAILLWISLLLAELAYRHERSFARPFRRYAWACQGVILTAGTAASWQKSPWAGVVIGFMASMAMTVWSGFLKAVSLSPEDQEVMDRIIEQHRLRQRERFEEEQRRRRAVRLAAAAARYGSTLSGEALAEEASSPSIRWEIPSRKHPSMVYFMRNGNRVKIGITTDLRRRIRTLALRAEHVALLEEGGREEERAYHKRFAQYRDGNTEWFRCTGELQSFIADQVEKIRREHGAS
ncbi:GIY-YIG nuclease family protein [Streptomyces goshikiensis]|uniref:GIY-YIG nuclease family protein n=1 Tax=Streptomyces goshikiensis TaxID=1942 RepID=UPI0036DCE5BB